jgi:hypothetical protein
MFKYKITLFTHIGFDNKTMPIGQAEVSRMFSVPADLMNGTAIADLTAPMNRWLTDVAKWERGKYRHFTLVDITDKTKTRLICLGQIPKLTQ